VLSKSVIHTSGRHTLQTVVVRIVVREISVGVSYNLLAVFASVLFPLVVEVALSIRHGDQHKNTVVHEVLDPLICFVVFYQKLGRLYADILPNSLITVHASADKNLRFGGVMILFVG